MKNPTAWKVRSNIWAHTPKLLQLQDEKRFTYLKETSGDSFKGNGILCRTFKGKSDSLEVDLIKKQFTDTVAEDCVKLVEGIDQKTIITMFNKTKDFLIHPHTKIPYNQSYKKPIYLVKNLNTDTNTVEGCGVFTASWDINIYLDADNYYHHKLQIRTWAFAYEEINELEEDFRKIQLAHQDIIG